MCGAVRELFRLIRAGRQFAKDMAQAAEQDVQTLADLAHRSNDEIDELLAS